MAVRTDLRFQVSSQKGVPVKLEKDVNDLSKAHRPLPAAPNERGTQRTWPPAACPLCPSSSRGALGVSKLHPASDGDATVLSGTPSAAGVPLRALDSSWTPACYQAKRIQVIKKLNRTTDAESTRLGDWWNSPGRTPSKNLLRPVQNLSPKPRAGYARVL